MGVDGVSSVRRDQAIAPPFARHSSSSFEFLPRRPLPRQPGFVGANERLRHRSTANPATLLRLFGRIRALVFAMWAVTRIKWSADHFTARCGRHGHLPFAIVAGVWFDLRVLPLAAFAGVVLSAVFHCVGPCSLSALVRSLRIMPIRPIRPIRLIAANIVVGDASNAPRRLLQKTMIISSGKFSLAFFPSGGFIVLRKRMDFKKLFPALVPNFYVSFAEQFFRIGMGI